MKALAPEQKVLSYVKAFFDYHPYDDSLCPCPEAGLAFQYGDILAIVQISVSIFQNKALNGILATLRNVSELFLPFCIIILHANVLCCLICFYLKYSCKLISDN